MSQTKSSPASHKLVEVSHFKMAFGDHLVIKDLSFTVKRGEVFGLLGSNGSGKTTTIRTLLGLYQATGGSLLIDGRPFNPAYSPTIGYLPEERGLYQKENVFDIMMYFARLKKVAQPETWIRDYLEKVNLTPFVKTRVNKLSQGMQQKVQLGITIMGQPKLLILDEPTKGFDPVNRQLLLAIIESLRAKGTAVILISHDMNEVQKLCDRILLLKDGVAAAYGPLATVRKQFGGLSLDRIFVKVYGEDYASEARASKEEFKDEF